MRTKSTTFDPWSYLRTRWQVTIIIIVIIGSKLILSRVLSRVEAIRVYQSCPTTINVALCFLFRITCRNGCNRIVLFLDILDILSQFHSFIVSLLFRGIWTHDHFLVLVDDLYVGFVRDSEHIASVSVKSFLFANEVTLVGLHEARHGSLELELG